MPTVAKKQYEAGRIIHPGEILLHEFLYPLNLTDLTVASAINVAPSRISKIVSCEQGISIDTALRLARYFGTAPDFWLHLQVRFELEKAMEKLGNALDEITPLSGPSA